jgi:hypothetical protein
MRPRTGSPPERRLALSLPLPRRATVSINPPQTPASDEGRSRGGALPPPSGRSDGVTPFAVCPVGPAAVGLADTGREPKRVELPRREDHPESSSTPTRPCATVNMSIADTTSVSRSAAVMYSPRSRPSTSWRDTHGGDQVRAAPASPRSRRLDARVLEVPGQEAATRFALRTSTAINRRPFAASARCHADRAGSGLGTPISLCRAVYGRQRTALPGHRRTAGSGRDGPASAGHRPGERPRRPAPPPVA